MKTLFCVEFLLSSHFTACLSRLFFWVKVISARHTWQSSDDGHCAFCTDRCICSSKYFLWLPRGPILNNGFETVRPLYFLLSNHLENGDGGSTTFIWGDASGTLVPCKWQLHKGSLLTREGSFQSCLPIIFSTRRLRFSLAAFFPPLLSYCYTFCSSPMQSTLAFCLQVH